jgi:hypothetical protein
MAGMDMHKLIWFFGLCTTIGMTVLIVIAIIEYERADIAGCITLLVFAAINGIQGVPWLLGLIAKKKNSK